MTAPVIAITGWRRSLPTYLGDSDLYTLGGEYADVVTAAGGVPVILPEVGADAVAGLLGRVDGVLLSGGQDLAGEGGASVDRARDATEFAVLAQARRVGMPVFGICRGLQVANVLLGGTLVDDLAASDAHPQIDADTDQLARRHIVTARSAWVADTLPAGGVVNSIHHQAVDVLSEGLAVAAVAEDGTVEAVEAATPGWFLRAVQWHPEKLPGDEGRDHATRILSPFIAACAAWADERSTPAPSQPLRKDHG
jgi:putative glutamine amidotransferase